MKTLRLISLVTVASGLAVVLGCGSGIRAFHDTADHVSLTGTVRGGKLAVVGASIQIYAAGTSGIASTALPLLHEPVQTDSAGVFHIPSTYTCPSSSAQVYLTARGGSTSTSSENNPSIALMTWLGECGTLPSVVTVDEVTTVASVWPLAPFMTSATNLGAPSGDSSLTAAVALAHQLADFSSGLTPGSGVPEGFVVQSDKLNSLANLLANCVDSYGGRVGDASPCGHLFTLATPGDVTPPTDTLAASLNLARHQDLNVPQLFRLIPSTSTYLPSLSVAPANWNLDLVAALSPPTISPASGTYPLGQNITLASASTGATIFYTLDGSTPTTSSSIYAGPLTLASTQVTLKAISVLNGISSALSTETLQGVRATLSFASIPTSAIAGQPFPINPTVRIVDSISGKLLPNASAVVMLSLKDNPGSSVLGGNTTLTAINGIASFTSLNIAAPGSGYSLIASSSSTTSAVSARFNVVQPDMTLSLPSLSLKAGASGTGTVTLSVAPITPVTVSFTSNSPSVLSVTSAVLLGEGQTTAAFTYKGLGPGLAILQATTPGFKSITAAITISPPASPTTLREAAAQRKLLMGTAADSTEFGEISPLISDSLYASNLSAQYSMLQPENAMKWAVLHPSVATYDFSAADALVNFAQANGMKVRGHTLVWDQAAPSWLTTFARGASTVQMAALLQEHITSVLSHYKGKVFAWDVVNEAIDDNATADGTQMKDSIWYNQPGIGLSGTGYIEQSFRWAHQADPNALLFYNDYNIYGPSPRFTALLNMLRDFKVRGVPIHGVGLQMHVLANGWPDTAGLVAAMQQITDLGLQVHITEMDVALPVPSTGVASSADLQAQAKTYSRVLSACLQNPGCTAFQTWGFTDKHSWIPASMPGYGAALPLGSNYKSKPAFDSILNTLIATPRP